MNHPRRLLGGLLVAGLALGGLAACTGDDPAPAAAPSTTLTPTSTPTPTPAPPPPPPPTWPLTGLTGDVVPRPALAVKIENSVDARPQTGLDAADVVWEEVVEGGITRFVAVYQSTLPPRIGPVRSIRPMDPAIAAPLHGLLAFSGGVPGYVTAARDAGLQVVSQDSGAPGFARTSTRKAPHNVYADPSVLVGQADDAHQAPPAPQFDVGQPTPGAPATRLDLTMSGVSHPRWSWNGQAWLRAEGTAPAVTAEGRQLSATNVVVLRVDVVQTAARDPAGNPVPETQLVGSGAATVAVGGTTVDARWTKGAVGDRLVLTGAADGMPVRLAPGTTWVELVPNRSGNVAVG